MNAIEVRGLSKSYGTQVVLDSIDLEVAEGTVFALLGPNGAGKTTAIHILSTLISADAGVVLIGGHAVARQPDKVRKLIGLTGQVSAVDGQFTGEENLRLMADLTTSAASEDGSESPISSSGSRGRLDLTGDPRLKGFAGRWYHADRPLGSLTARRRAAFV